MESKDFTRYFCMLAEGVIEGVCSIIEQSRRTFPNKEIRLVVFGKDELTEQEDKFMRYSMNKYFRKKYNRLLLEHETLKSKYEELQCSYRELLEKTTGYEQQKD